VKALEKFVGISIDVTLEYEDYRFTKETYSSAASVLKSRRAAYFLSARPRSIEASEETQSSAAQCSMKATVTEAKKRKVENKRPKVVGSKPRQSKIRSKSSPAVNSNAASKTDDSVISVHESTQNTNSNPDGDALLNSGNVERNTAVFAPIQDEDSTSSSNYFLSCPSPAEASRRSSSAGSNNETQGRSAETKDAGTSTDPICGICHSSYPPSTSKTIPSNQVFWIRCFNPLCHFMIHPICTGFRITSPDHLELLPPYFCENHRTNRS
jgi:hypothetical protein